MKFECSPTGYRRPVNQKADFRFSVKKDPSPPKNIGEEMFQEQYLLTCKIGYSFYSNTAQLPHKKKDAVKAIYAQLFKDMIPIVQHILTNYDHGEEVRESAVHLLGMMREPKVEQNDE